MAVVVRAPRRFPALRPSTGDESYADEHEGDDEGDDYAADEHDQGEAQGNPTADTPVPPPSSAPAEADRSPFSFFGWMRRDEEKKPE